MWPLWLRALRRCRANSCRLRGSLRCGAHERRGDLCCGLLLLLLLLLLVLLILVVLFMLLLLLLLLFRNARAEFCDLRRRDPGFDLGSSGRLGRRLWLERFRLGRFGGGGGGLTRGPLPQRPAARATRRADRTRLGRRDPLSRAPVSSPS